TSGRLLLQVYSPVSGQTDLTVSYLTPNAYWLPAYDLRVDNITKPIKISYKAKLVQTSGIDWKQVKLSLSTSTPAQRNNAPDLKTWFLTYVYPNTFISDVLQGKAAGVQMQGVSSLNEVVVVGYGSKRKEEEDKDNSYVEPIYVVNGNIISGAEFRKIKKNAFKTYEVLKNDAAIAT